MLSILTIRNHGGHNGHAWFLKKCSRLFIFLWIRQILYPILSMTHLVMTVYVHICNTSFNLLQQIQWILAEYEKSSNYPKKNQNANCQSQFHKWDSTLYRTPFVLALSKLHPVHWITFFAFFIVLQQYLIEWVIYVPARYDNGALLSIEESFCPFIHVNYHSFMWELFFRG